MLELNYGENNYEELNYDLCLWFHGIFETMATCWTMCSLHRIIDPRLNSVLANQ